MPSFLVTREMSPALAARVMASVSGRRQDGSRRGRRSLTALLRATTVALLAVSVGSVMSYRQRTQSELVAARGALLGAARSASRALTTADRDVLKQVEAAIVVHSAPSYAGDFIADDLQGSAHFPEALKAPTLYVRGPLEGLARPDAVAALARESSKDSFVLCWLDPPDTRTDKALRAKARAANARGGSMDLTASVERLAPLFQGLPFLSKEFERRVESAETAASVDGLRKAFDKAPIAAALRAAKARQLLIVLDEAGDGKGVTELDGERPHPVRVVLSDLTNGQVRLRFRGKVDPGGIGASFRAEYARGIDSCTLAMDLRDAASGNVSVTQR